MGQNHNVSGKAHNKAGELALAIYQDVLAAVSGDRLMRDAVRRNGTLLEIQDKRFTLDEFAHVFVCGCGKASFGMARTLVEILGPFVSGGLVITKHGHGGDLRGVEVFESSHPVPDEDSLEAGRKMLEFAAKTGPDDLVLFALSGGASALMESLIEGVTLQQVQELTQKLLAEGKNIFYMNAARSKLSNVKAGGLGKAFSPSRVGVLVLSDVYGDRLDTIGSGPFWNESSDEWIPMGAGNYWEQKEPHLYLFKRIKGDGWPEFNFEELKRLVGPPRTAKSRIVQLTTDPSTRSGRIFHRFIGSSMTGLQTAEASLTRFGLRPVEHLNPFLGRDARVEAKEAASALRVLKKAGKDIAIFCGEPTVVIRGDGKGGRCQELACAAAPLIAGIDGVAILAGSTDGTDGPTDVGAAIVDGDSVRRAAEKGITPEAALETSDSFAFLEACDGLIYTGPTQSNVNDIVIVVRHQE